MLAPTIVRLLTLAAGALALSACASSVSRLSDIGQPPELTPVEDPRALYGYQPVVMPAPPMEVARPELTNSLWRANARSFFRDPRAAYVGDILTVQIDISDEAKVQNSTDRSLTSSEASELNAFLGLENALGAAFPAGFDPTAAVDLGSNSSSSGTGTVNRSESVNLTVAAVITQVLPNGNLVIAGRQEVRINSEVRELLITGIVRPADITSANTVRHTQIAEARISYGGRGVLTDVQGPRWGQETWGVIAPF